MSDVLIYFRELMIWGNFTLNKSEGSNWWMLLVFSKLCLYMRSVKYFDSRMTFQVRVNLRQSKVSGCCSHFSCCRTNSLRGGESFFVSMVKTYQTSFPLFPNLDKIKWHGMGVNMSACGPKVPGSNPHLAKVCDDVIFFSVSLWSNLILFN